MSSGYVIRLCHQAKSSGYVIGDNRTWGPNIRGSSTGNRQTSNERPTQGTQATGRGDFWNRSHASPGMSHASQGRNNPSDSDGREVPSTEPLSGGNFEEEDLSERQKCSALTSKLEGTALNCVMAKKQYQRDTAEKIFEILLNRFGSGVQGHQAMMRFEKRRQREDETIGKFLDNLEMLRRRSQPDESNRKMSLAVASKFIDFVKNDELRTILATHYTRLSSNAPTPEELRLKSKEYLLLKPHLRSGYYYGQLWL